MSSVSPVNKEENDKFIMPALPESSLKIEGYGSIGLVVPEAVKIDPAELLTGPRHEFKEKYTIINDDEAIQELAVFLGANCCYGKGMLKNMEVLSIKRHETYRYCLETFVETRTTRWSQEPYKGGPVRGIESGPVPGPWQIDFRPTDIHVSNTHYVRIPNTEQVQVCVRCSGHGGIRCTACLERGHTNCHSCQGKGTKESGKTCTACGGRGDRKCVMCHTSGYRQCDSCLGTGQLKWFLELVVNFTNHVDDFLKDTAVDDIPDSVIRLARAELLFEEINLRVQAINHHSDPDINKSSASLISKHQLQFGNQKILSQKHQVTVIPISSINYRYKGVQGDYYVYGLDRQVYFPDYPEKCCWGCTIV